MLQEKTTLVISRYWDHPKITVKVTDEHIQIEIPAEDLLKALSAEVNHPITIFSRKSLENELLKNLPLVLEKIKEASASAV